MRCLVQRVSQASVTVDGQIVGAIDHGLLVLVGVGHADADRDVVWMADKLVGLRIFDDTEGKMNLSVQDVAGAILVVSQFTLWGDARKGRRPSYTGAAPPELANALYEQLVAALCERGISVATGQFQQHMQVALVNDGPVTLWIESPTR
jgi:D-tyrosyl-tRNA(Tyr) deacylase